MLSLLILSPEEVSVRDGVGKREKGYNHKESSIVLPIVSAKKKVKRQEVINLKSRLEKEKKMVTLLRKRLPKNIQKRDIRPRVQSTLK